jgi:predicted dehydrogenase
MTGLSPKRVFGEMGTYVHPVTVEDMLCATLRFNNNALGMVSIGTAARGKGSSLFTLFGDQGQIDVRDFSGRSINAFTLKKDEKYKPDKWHKAPVGPAVNPRARFMEEAAKALLAGKPLPVPGKDGVRCQRTINAIYRSAHEHAPVVFE